MSEQIIGCVPDDEKTQQPQPEATEQEQQEHSEHMEKMIKENEDFLRHLHRRVYVYRALHYAWIAISVLIGASAIGWAVMGQWMYAACNAAWVFVALMRANDQRILVNQVDTSLKYIDSNITLRHIVSHYQAMTTDYQTQINIYKELKHTYDELTSTQKAQIAEQERTINRLLSILDMRKPNDNKEE